MTVSDIFNTPRLSDLALRLKAAPQHSATQLEPFSLLTSQVHGLPGTEISLNNQTIREKVSKSCNSKPEDIEDAYPCTSLQEGLLAMTAKRKGDYVSHRVFQIQKYIDLGQFKKAWEIVYDASPLLRTRFVTFANQLLQVVVKQSLPWTRDPDESLRVGGYGEEMRLGDPLSRFYITSDSSSDGPDSFSHFHLELHHALYDAWSISLIYDHVEFVYKNLTPELGPPFSAFVAYSMASRGDQAKAFWRDQFENLDAAPFPALPSATYHPKADQNFWYSIDNLMWPRSNITASTVLRSAWAILLAKYTDSRDVVFGAVVSGRQAAVPGIDRIVGPTIGKFSL